MGGTFTEAKEKVTWEKEDGRDPKGQWPRRLRLTGDPMQKYYRTETVHE